MRIKTTLAGAAVVAAAGAVGVLGTPIAAADDVTTTTIGKEAKLTDGSVVQGWTVTDLKASTDQIPYPVAGTLWEATATDQAIQGSATPIVSNLNARARSGETYRVLFGVATPQGVNPATLAQGQKATGKVYFDVVGDTPDSVVYNAGGEDLLVWVQPPPQLPTQRGGGSYSSTSPVSPSTPTTTTPAAPTTTAGPAAPSPVPGAPAAAALPGSAGTPLPAGSQGTPLAPVTPAPAATGSQGTPLPTGASATAAPSTTVIAPPPPA